jgi:alpha-D-ribose 1-methylphosphonate 5-triphosphate synthase subunit PhnG
MDRTTRSELIARLTDTEIAELAAMVVSDADVIVTGEPTVGMVMARVIEGAFGEVFNLGEVLVTECQVQVGGVDGWCMLQGYRPQAAVDAAAIDAALVLQAPHLTTALDDRLTQLIARHDDIVAANQSRLAATRVQFETQ